MIRRVALALLMLAAVGCAGPARRPEPAATGPDLGQRVSSVAAGVVRGYGPALHGPGGGPGGMGMTHTAGAVGSPSGAGDATGAAPPPAGVSALVIGNVAIIGIDPVTAPSGVAPDLLQTGVRTRVHERFPQFSAVYVVTDAERSSRVAHIHRAMLMGTPASALMDEMLEVVRTAQ